MRVQTVNGGISAVINANTVHGGISAVKNAKTVNGGISAVKTPNRTRRYLRRQTNRSRKASVTSPTLLFTPNLASSRLRYQFTVSVLSPNCSAI